MANPATHPRDDKRANRSRALHHSISLKRALVTATDTAPRKSQRPEGRWEKRSGQYGLQAKSMPPQEPYRPYHEPSAMPARSKTPWRRGQISGPAHAISRASCRLPFRYGCPHTQSSNKQGGEGGGLNNSSIFHKSKIRSRRRPLGTRSRCVPARGQATAARNVQGGLEQGAAKAGPRC